LNSDNNQNHFVFFIENNYLKKCFIRNISNFYGYEFKEIKTGISTDVFKEMNELFIKRTYYIIESILKLIITRFLYRNKINIHERKDQIFILTWMDLRSFDKNFNYNDPFFGDMPLKLRERGKKIIIVPYILNNFVSILKSINKSNEEFLLIESFLNIYDILHINIINMLDIPKRKKYPSFVGFEISDIIYDENKRNWREPRTSSLLLLYKFVNKLNRNRVPIDVFIYTYENHIREKILNMALKEYYPETLIIGYQHATVSKMYLDHFFSREELNVLPLPDRLITNGKYYEKLFKESGYPPDKLFCGGAIRYSNLVKSMNITIQKRIRTGPPSIHVTTSTGMNEAIELLWKVFEAFKNSLEYKIIIKSHPSMPYKYFSKRTDHFKLPSHFSISDQPVTELLKESDILIYTTSSTCVEALALGVPVIHVESDFIVDMEILDFKPEIRYSARNKEALKEQVVSILKMKEKDLLEKRVEWRQTALEIFGNIDEKTYDLFLR